MENRSAEGYVIRMFVEDAPINEDGSIDYNFTVHERIEDLLEEAYWGAEDIAYVRVTIEEIPTLKRTGIFATPWRWCLLCRKRNQEGDTSCCVCGASQDYLVSYPVGEGDPMPHSAQAREGRMPFASFARSGATHDPEGVDAYCFFCEKRFADRHLDPDDYYCYGCHEYVCDDCNLNAAVCGPHAVMDHVAPDAE